MVLGDEQGVTDLTGCTESALISRQLVNARAELADILSKKGLSVPTSSTVMGMAVNYLASALIAIQPGAVNPTSNFSTEDFSRSDGGNESQVNFYHAKAMNIIGNYLSVTASAPPGSYIVGRTGVRVGEFEEMSDSEEVNY
jgi:hypothetical protein